MRLWLFILALLALTAFVVAQDEGQESDVGESMEGENEEIAPAPEEQQGEEGPEEEEAAAEPEMEAEEAPAEEGQDAAPEETENAEEGVEGVEGGEETPEAVEEDEAPPAEASQVFGEEEENHVGDDAPGVEEIPQDNEKINASEALDAISDDEVSTADNGKEVEINEDAVQDIEAANVGFDEEKKVEKEDSKFGKWVAHPLFSKITEVNTDCGCKVKWLKKVFRFPKRNPKYFYNHHSVGFGHHAHHGHEHGYEHNGHVAHYGHNHGHGLNHGYGHNHVIGHNHGYGHSHVIGHSHGPKFHYGSTFSHHGHFARPCRGHRHFHPRHPIHFPTAYSHKTIHKRFDLRPHPIKKTFHHFVRNHVYHKKPCACTKKTLHKHVIVHQKIKTVPVFKRFHPRGHCHKHWGRNHY